MAVYKKSNSGYLPFVQKEKISSPFTDIQNRAKVDAALKCIIGNERIMVNSLRLVNEFGPNGQPVYEPDHSDSRVRFVGQWQTSFSANGMFQVTGNAYNNPDEYMEVTFYGTGLNILRSASNIGTDDINIDVEVDGVSQGITDIGNNSPVLTDRIYKDNTQSKVVEGLALGWHTVKIKGATGSQDFLRVYGFEVLNNATQITVKSGKAHGNGYEYTLESDQLIDHSLGFENILDANIGSKGGRSIVYIDPSDGQVKKRFTKTEDSILYMSSANHINEEIFRKINFRSFGVTRVDDFATLVNSTEDCAYTLDDGTTTLVGDNVFQVNTAGTGFYPASTGNTFTLTFVGTGLDVVCNGAANQVDNYNFEINGSVVASGIQMTPNGGDAIIKVASGLPYGTHTLKVTRNVGGTTSTFRDFIIYQPKKPTLPEGAIELADYNVVADFVAGSPGVDIFSTGVIRKAQTREFNYGGTWSINLDAPNRMSGFSLQTTSTNSFVEYVFYGTGFDLRYDSGASAQATLELDGSSDFSSYTVNNYGAMSFVNGTGVLSGNANNGDGIAITDLPLGFHTIRVTSNNANAFIFGGIDIVTPIYAPSTSTGSLSLKDCRNFDSQLDVNKKAKLKKKQILFNGAITTVQESFGISQIVRVSTGQWHVTFIEDFLYRPRMVGMHSDSGIVDFVDISDFNERYWGLKTANFNTLRGTDAAQRDADIIHVDWEGIDQKDKIEENE